jgi:hypothetical protein
MRFQKSQPAETRHECFSSASTGPLKIWMRHPARKAHANEVHEKAGSISITCKLPWPVRAIWRRGSPQSRCGGKPPPYAALIYSDARIHDFCQL